VAELLSSSLEARISRAVQAVIEERRAELERLVQAQVDEELERLVATDLEQRTNGNGAKLAGELTSARALTDEPAAPAKVCSGPCGRVLPAKMFEARRSRCRDCRREEQARHRERRRANRQTADQEPPRTDTAPAGEDPLSLA
jgi:hypothetical protein